MTYEERLKKLLGNNDLFWYTTIDNFVKATYDDEEQGISDLENLAKDSVKFNEFTRQIIQRRNDLKSVKDEFFKEENIDVEEISKKLVLDIQNLEDNAEVSISTLLNKKLDTKTMFDIYRLVIEKLQELGLYLNFGKYENQIAGLPFNIPFKKGYVQNIIISTRKYNGHYGKGSIFSDFVEFKLAGRNATNKTFISFCIDEKIKDEATLECSIPFNLKEEESIEINNLISEVESKYQPDDTEAQQISIPEYLKYTDININGIDYTINSDDEILTKLRMLIKCDLVNQILSKSYDSLINNQEKENVDTKTEKCLCGNTFELIWDENQKFQMVRCPQCNNEIKFKNPKLLINEEENSLAHELYKKNDDDKIWWVDNRDKVGEHVFTFDKKKYYNLFKDYPHNLTPEEQEIFDKENPYWVNFFADRK